jgi:hypothetical protein
LEIGDDLSKRGVNLVPRRSYAALQLRGVGIELGSQSKTNGLKFMKFIHARAALLYGAHRMALSLY